MKLSCSRSELRDALRAVSGVVDPRNIKPILKDVHLCAAEDTVELSATDLEVGIKCSIRDVTVTETGGIVIPSEPLHGIVTESPDERLSMSAEGQALHVKGKDSVWKVMGAPEDEFPEIPGFPDETSLEIEGAVLREMITSTIFAVALEKQRYALNGALFVSVKGSPRIEMVASDGRRMAWIQRKANNSSPFDAAAIIPVKALQQLEKMIGDEEIVRVIVEERRILMRSDRGVIVAQLLEGRFPAYREAIPQDSDKLLEIDSARFDNAIRQAAVVAARKSRAVIMTFQAEKAVIESSSAEAGDAHVEIPVKYEGEPLTIQFNPDYLIDGTRAMGDVTIRMEMKDSARAAVMRGGADYLYLVMPITQE